MRSTYNYKTQITTKREITSKLLLIPIPEDSPFLLLVVTAVIELMVAKVMRILLISTIGVDDMVITEYDMEFVLPVPIITKPLRPTLKTSPLGNVIGVTPMVTVSPPSMIMIVEPLSFTLLIAVKVVELSAKMTPVALESDKTTPSGFNKFTVVV